MVAQGSSGTAPLLLLLYNKTFPRHRDGKVSAADPSTNITSDFYNEYPDHLEERQGCVVTITFSKQQVYYANNTVN